MNQCCAGGRDASGQLGGVTHVELAGRKTAQNVGMEPHPRKWWALGDDFRTLPMNEIVANLPHFGQLSLG